MQKNRTIIKKKAPSHNFNNLSMENDTELLARCHHVYLFSLGDIIKLPRYGITEATLAHFHATFSHFSITLKVINN